MAKVEKLTEEQIAAMPGFVKSWVDRLDKSAPLDREAATKGAHWLYEFCNLKKPLTIFVASPMGLQFAAHFLKKMSPLAQVGAQVGDQVWDQVGAQVRDQVRAEKLSYESFCVYGSFVQDCYWVPFFEFFKEQKICRVDHVGFEAFGSLIKANVMDSIQLEGAYIGCEMPIELHRDSEGRLHSTGGMAIKWSDGWGFHAIHGVRMPEELHKKITERTITPAEVLALENIEQRMVALKILGAEFVIQALPNKKVDTGKNGNELFEVKIENEKNFCLKYKCPSTDRIYVSFVDPEVGAKKDADLAMAWKFGITKKMYQAMRLES